MTEKDIFIHPSAVVDEGCEIGTGTKVWHFSHLMDGCRIGKGCNIGQNVFIASNVIIGSNVKIQNNVSVYEGVTCEDDVFLGPSMVFTNILTPRSHISRKNLYSRTLVGKGATIGANATIVCPRVIGSYALIGAGSVVTHDVPEYALVHGNPATQAGWVCSCGNRLDEEDEGLTCPECGSIYVRSENGLDPGKK